MSKKVDHRGVHGASTDHDSAVVKGAVFFTFLQCAVANVKLAVRTPCHGLAGYAGTMRLTLVCSGYSYHAKKLGETQHAYVVNG